MSEATAPAPAAPAANTVPSDGAKPEAAVDPYAEYNAVLSAKPVKYKAGGKEREVRDMRELIRKAEKADGLDAKAQEVLQRERQAQEVLQMRERLKTAKTPKERIAILRELSGADEFDEAAEEAILERIEREKSLSSLTPSERAAKEEAESLRARLAEYEARQAKAKEEAERQAEEAEFASLRDTLAMHTVKALQAMKLPKTAVADAGRRLAAMLARSAQLGHELGPEDLALEAVKSAAPDFRGYTASLEGDALLEFIGPDVAAKVSKALLAKHYGETSVKAVQPQVSQAERPVERNAYSSPMAAWKALERGGK